MRDVVPTFRLDQVRIDDDLLRWVRLASPNIESIAQASAEPGFNLKTLMTDVLDGQFAMGGDVGKLGPLSALLEDFGYWLFVGLGRPRRCIRQRSPWTVTDKRRQVTYDGRRVVLSVDGGADPILIPIRPFRTRFFRLPTRGPSNAPGRASRPRAGMRRPSERRRPYGTVFREFD